MLSPLEGWLSLTGRRSRLNYVATIALVAAVLGAAAYGMILIGFKGATLFYIQTSLAAMAVGSFILVSAQRFRDMGLPGMLALLCPFPVLYFHNDPVMAGAVVVAMTAVLGLLPGVDSGPRRISSSGNPVQLR